MWVEKLQLQSKFETTMASHSRFQWISKSSEVTFIAYKRFTIQTLLLLLEFVIHQNCEHDTIAVSNLAEAEASQPRSATPVVRQKTWVIRINLKYQVVIDSLLRISIRILGEINLRFYSK